MQKDILNMIEGEVVSGYREREEGYKRCLVENEIAFNDLTKEVRRLQMITEDYKNEACKLRQEVLLYRKGNDLSNKPDGIFGSSLFGGSLLGSASIEKKVNNKYPKNYIKRYPPNRYNREW